MKKHPARLYRPVTAGQDISVTLYLDGSIVVGFYLDDGKYACFCFSVDASRQVPLVGIGSIGCSGRRYGETVGLRQVLN